MIHKLCRDLVFQQPEVARSLLVEAGEIICQLRRQPSYDNRLLNGEQAENQRLSGVIEFYSARYVEALRHFEAARDLFAESDHLEGPGNCWNNIAMVYRYLDDFERALEYYRKALARAREVGDVTAEANTLGNIGILFYAMGALAEAKGPIKGALNRAVSVGNNTLEMIWSSNLAELYLSQGQLDKVAPLLQRALQLGEEIGDVALRIDALRNLATLHVRQRAFDKACSLYQEALAEAEDFADRRMTVQVLIDMGKFILQSPPNATLPDKVSDPGQILSKALHLADSIGVLSILAEVHGVLAQCNEQKGDLAQAYTHLKEHTRLSGEAKAEETERKLRRQRTLFEIDQTRRELEASRKANAELEAEVNRRKEVEAELRDTLRLARHADEVKTRFLATISHEIRTPMNGMLGMTEILSRSPLNEDQSEAVRVIYEAGHDLLGLINDILDLTKLEAGRVQLRDEQFSLAEVIDSLRDWAEKESLQKGLPFTCHFPSSLHRIYRGDAGRLQQVLRCLLSNAFKFTSEGTVSLEVVPSAKPEWIRFTVKDTGIGISADQFDSIFDIFTQIDGSTTRRYGGTGLGLALARKLGELMGGHIDVRSELEKGSCFTFELPLQEGDKLSEDAPVSFTSDTCDPNLRVLVVEDTEFNWKVANLLLKRLGIEAQWASNGFKAIDLLKEQDFDLILMDMEMPGIDGAETTRRIRALAPDGHGPQVIALTAYSMEENDDYSRAANVDGVLIKPIQLDKLRRVLMGCVRM